MGPMRRTEGVVHVQIHTIDEFGDECRIIAFFPG